MAEDIVIGTLAHVGAGDVLRRRNRQTSHTTLEADAVPVMEPERHAVHVEVRGVRLGDEELHSLVVLVPLREKRIHHEFEGVPTLVVAVSRLLCDPRMVAHVTRNHEVEVGVGEEEVDA